MDGKHGVLLKLSCSGEHLQCCCSGESALWMECQKYQLGPIIPKLNWSIWLEYCPDLLFFFSKQSFWNYHYQYTNACWRLVGSDIGSDVIREPLMLAALEQETFSLRNTILENCRLRFNINQISTLNMISENNLIFLFFPPLFFSCFFPKWSNLHPTTSGSWNEPMAACNLDVSRGNCRVSVPGSAIHCFPVSLNLPLVPTHLSSLHVFTLPGEVPYALGTHRGIHQGIGGIASLYIGS